MKVGDLVGSNGLFPSKVFLVVRTGKARPEHGPYFCDKVIWLYPDPDGACNHTDDSNYYFKRFFEVVNESR